MSDEATRWATKRLLGPLPAAEQKLFEDWMAKDQRHQGALIRAETGLALIARARVMTPIEDAPLPMSRRHMLRWGTGAAIAASIGGLWLLAPADRLTTQTGEIRRARLADTSTVLLNTQSSVSVNLEPHERRIALDRGEAWFQVAHDRSRPFVVSAGDLRVRAVGTAFSVRRLADGADVLVTEGKVEVWRTTRPDAPVAIASGRRAFASDDGLPIVAVKAGAGIERALAWRSGRLALSGETLDYAVAEMNRYNDVQVRVGDPELGRKPIIGRFRVDDPSGFARSVAVLENARVQSDGNSVVIVPVGS